ncbi:hypothetical protein AHF37_06755 [Paragonimus kellicotti]|nr:hypothetical protein AHF37_06755 [Paragonimus kellicotti]
MLGDTLERQTNQPTTLWYPRGPAMLLTYLLVINPNTTTFWNYRRRAIQSTGASIHRELWLTKLILRTHPRSNETIFHRRWIVQHHLAQNMCFLMSELDLCDQIADRYRMHYGLWDYRRFILHHLGSQPVFTKDYRDGIEKWTAGRILRRTGRVTYDVEVQSSIWVRHANQLRPSFQPVTVPSSRVIPLDILLDTFELPQDVSAAAPNPEAHPPSICTPRRWTDRSRRQVVHMQVNPRQQVITSRRRC